MTQMFVALWIFLAINIGLQTWRIVLNLWEPFFYHSVRVVTPQVKRGEDFILSLDLQRYRICKVDIDRFMISDVTKAVFYRERIIGGAAPIGRITDIRNTVPIPKNAPLGKVTLIQNVQSDCIDGMHSIQVPTLHFEITD